MGYNSNYELDVSEGLKYILAGKAEFTLRFLHNGNDAHFTYKVYRPNPQNENFYLVLVKAGAKHKYSFLGTISNERGYLQHKKSWLPVTSRRAKGFKWVYEKLAVGVELDPTIVKMYHTNRCGKCGQKLTVPESITRGLGPVCWKYVYGVDRGKVH